MRYNTPDVLPLTASDTQGEAGPASEVAPSTSPESAQPSRRLGGSGSDLVGLPLASIARIRESTANALRPALRRQLSEILRNPDVLDALVVARREGWPIKVQVHVDMPEDVLAEIQARREAEYEAAALFESDSYAQTLSPDTRLQRARMTREERIAEGLSLLAIKAAARMDAYAAVEPDVELPALASDAEK